MPVTVRKNKRGGYTVKTPGGTKAKNTSKVKAKKQKRLLQALDHGFQPTKSRSKGRE